jgi:hypothetical protein
MYGRDADLDDVYNAIKELGMSDSDRRQARRDAYYQAALTGWLAMPLESCESLDRALKHAEDAMAAADEANEREAKK